MSAHLLVRVRVFVLNGNLKCGRCRNHCNSTQSENVTIAANVLPSTASGFKYFRTRLRAGGPLRLVTGTALVCRAIQSLAQYLLRAY